MKASIKSHGRSNIILHRSGSSLTTPISDLAQGAKFLIKSHSTAEIGVDRVKDEKREKQMREMVRQFAQPKKPQPLTPRDKRRKQVDAIYAYLRSHGMPEIPYNITSALEEFVNDNKRYLAWLPTEPQYFVVCEPITETNNKTNSTNTIVSIQTGPTTTPTRDRQMTISMNSPLSKFDFGEDFFDPTMANIGTGKPEGFLSSMGKPQGFLSSIDGTEEFHGPMGFLECFADDKLPAENFSMNFNPSYTTITTW